MFCNVAVDVNIGVHVALPHNTPRALLQITRSPRCIQVMQGNQTILTIRACAHFCRAAKQNSHIAGAYFAEKLLLFGFGVGFVDERNLLARNAHIDQLPADIVVYIIEVVCRQFAGFDKCSILYCIVFYGRRFAGRR